MNASLVALLLTVFVLNSYASLLLYRSPRYEARQKWFQLGLVWLLPPLGALLVIYLTREPKPGRRSADYSADYGSDRGDMGLSNYAAGDCSSGDSGGGGDCGGGDGGGGGD